MSDIRKPGYYTVGSSIFYSKSLALLEATRTKLQPFWHFADEVFSTLNWSQPPVDDINELYKQRARQLRETYDYLVLSFSGGSDSNTALKSFLSQGLIVDEILVKWPVSATEGRYQISNNKTPENILSEWDLAIKPALSYLSAKYPNLKITVQDWSNEVDMELEDEDWFTINDYMNPGVFKKFSGTVGTETERKIIDSGKTAATIWGIDKPQLAFKDGNIYLYFLDKLANTRFVEGTHNRTAELFFWTPDFPEIVLNQAKLVYEYFVQNPDKLKLIDWDKKSLENKIEYDKIVKSIIYPSWDSSIFQADKPSSIVWSEYDAWMFKDMGNYRYYKSWDHGLRSVKNSINPKYYQIGPGGRFDGWIGFVSPFYKLGPAYKLDNIK